jgi:hypothetical protein
MADIYARCLKQGRGRKQIWLLRDIAKLLSRPDMYKNLNMYNVRQRHIDEMHSRQVKVAVSLWRGTLLFKRTAEK